MARQVEYTDFIRPICILFRQQLETPLSYNVTGWGRNEHNQWSRTLQGTTVYNTDRSFCINEFTVNVDQSQICAYSYTSDTCGGDSGGPLSAEVSYRGITLPVQFGILNYGSRLCRKVGINVYANVMHYTDWLERTLMRNSDN
ncbi:serine protease grass-like [Drosophila eugracilis]|uniref:serine protease grass-like n=1 Tax=Drosophila eugracilis TaxID=29029 RepID=UPI001BDA1C72|nr:serine protease grass-like [Drosophila eugracilis]